MYIGIFCMKIYHLATLVLTFPCYVRTAHFFSKQVEKVFRYPTERKTGWSHFNQLFFVHQNLTRGRGEFFQTLFFVRNQTVVFIGWLAYTHTYQGCQIFRRTIYQNEKNIPNDQKSTKWSLNIQIKYVKYSKWPEHTYNNIFHSMILPNIPKFGKETIWQPWYIHT
jgi:hypothetical protein